MGSHDRNKPAPTVNFETMSHARTLIAAKPHTVVIDTQHKIEAYEVNSSNALDAFHIARLVF